MSQREKGREEEREERSSSRYSSSSPNFNSLDHQIQEARRKAEDFSRNLRNTRKEVPLSLQFLSFSISLLLFLHLSFFLLSI
jgi:hypothetical protein